jgi:MFS family permease
VVVASSLAFAGVAGVLAWVRSVPLVAIALLVAGYCWISINSSMNASAQTVLPDWVRSRGMSLYLLTFQGAQALGALIWGLVASRWDTRASLTVVAGGLLLAPLVARRWPLRTRPIDVRLSDWFPEPRLEMETEPSHGPVLVEVQYEVPPENADAFRAAMERVGRSRRRAGAQRWGLFQDGAHPDRFVEAYIVQTWEEHLRQSQERYTRADEAYVQEARSLVREGTRPVARHLVFAYNR